MSEYTAKRDRTRAPTHPGALLRDEVLPALDISVMGAAERLHVTRQTLHRLLAERTAVTPAMALRLGKFCGNGRISGFACRMPMICGTRAKLAGNSCPHSDRKGGVTQAQSQEGNRSGLVEHAGIRPRPARWGNRPASACFVGSPEQREQGVAAEILAALGRGLGATPRASRAAHAATRLAAQAVDFPAEYGVTALNDLLAAFVATGKRLPERHGSVLRCLCRGMRGLGSKPIDPQGVAVNEFALSSLRQGATALRVRCIGDA